MTSAARRFSIALLRLGAGFASGAQITLACHIGAKKPRRGKLRSSRAGLMFVSGSHQPLWPSPPPHCRGLRRRRSDDGDVRSIACNITTRRCFWPSSRLSYRGLMASENFVNSAARVSSALARCCSFSIRLWWPSCSLLFSAHSSQRAARAFALFANCGLHRRPVLFLRGRQFEPGLQTGDFGVDQRRAVFIRELPLGAGLLLWRVGIGAGRENRQQKGRGWRPRSEDVSSSNLFPRCVDLAGVRRQCSALAFSLVVRSLAPACFRGMSAGKPIVAGLRPNQDRRGKSAGRWNAVRAAQFAHSLNDAPSASSKRPVPCSRAPASW